jgi:hypothetical protein
MFEELEEEEKQERESRKRLLRDSAVIIGALVALGVIAYLIWRPATRPPVSTPSPAPAAQAAPPDAARDLQVVRAVMGKDVSGLRVRWSVTIRNKSAAYTYSDFKYEADFVGPDGRTLSTTADTIRDSVEPGEEKTIPDFANGLYNANASTYHFRLVGAEAKQ